MQGSETAQAVPGQQQELVSASMQLAHKEGASTAWHRVTTCSIASTCSAAGQGLYSGPSIWHLSETLLSAFAMPKQILADY